MPTLTEMLAAHAASGGGLPRPAQPLGQLQRPMIEGILAKALRENPDSLREIIGRLQLSGGLNTESGQNYNVTSGGGRIGYRHPLGGDRSVTGGLSGEFAKGRVTAPGFEQAINDKRISGVDASYQSGPNTYGLQYQPQDKLLQLLYGRRF